MCPLSDKAQSTACRLQEELEKLRAAGPLESSGIEEVTQLKVEDGTGVQFGLEGLQGFGHCLSHESITVKRHLTKATLLK